MLALDILKNIRDIETEYDHRKEHRFDEAIAEIEALENRSCKGCKNINKSNCVFCLSCSRFYSDNWESKC